MSDCHGEGWEGVVPSRARVPLDYYPTPAHVVAAILPHLPILRSVFDPACGVGELLEAFPYARRDGIELDQARADLAASTGACVVQGDALRLQWPDADLAILNPPFTHAQAFIERALDWRSRDPRRTVACLARLTILESEARRELHQRNPSDVYILARRPKFRGDTNGTDSVTACWLVWGPGRGGHWRVL